MTNKTSVKNRSFKGESSFWSIAELVRIVNCATSQREIDNAGLRLLDLARIARLTREEQACSDASKLVMSMPVSHGLHLAADYYRIISQKELVCARDVLIRVAYSAPLEYRARVTYQIGYGYEIEGNAAEAARYYIEAAALAGDQDYLSRLHALSGLAYLRSEEGDHAGAVAGLEALLPMVRVLSRVYPIIYAEHLNNFAAVLSRAGMTDQAERAIAAALASTFAVRFPEWRETELEIEEAAKQSRQSAPTGKSDLIQLPAARERVRKPLGLFTVVRRRSNSTVARSDFPAGIVVSLLERYVRTVRIRDRPRP